MQKPKHPKYYEGILQLRNPTDEVLEYIKSQIDKNAGVFISKIDKINNGFDIYLSSKRYILQLGKRLISRFGGEFKTSAEHYSRDRMTSKDVYRVNVLYRYPGFKKGDIVNVRGVDIRVIRLGKKIIGINPATGKKLVFRYENLKN